MSISPSALVSITLKDGEPHYNNRPIILSTGQVAMLMGMPAGSSVLIRKIHLKFKTKEQDESS